MTQALAVHHLSSLISSARVSLSGTTTSGHFETRRSTTRKEGHFVYKHGQRHHSYDSEKAPYPLCYDRSVLDLESLENEFVQRVKGSVSFVDLEQRQSQRVLDLGCGLGTWVIDAAKKCPESEFVGFDLVDVQIPRSILDPSVAARIEWRHGNYLTTKLPVLGPGGSCEIIDEDMIFPILPRWFTQALRPRPKTSSVHLPKGFQHKHSSSRDQTTKYTTTHDHALLESLYNSVFENRFINTKPTALLPGLFTSYFRQIAIAPVLHYPMPPLAPMQSLPPQIVTTYVLEPETDTLNPHQSTIYPTPVPMTRPMSLSLSSVASSHINGTRVDSMYGSRPGTASPNTTAPESPTSHMAPHGLPKPQTGKCSGVSPPTPPSSPFPTPISQMPMKQFILDEALSAGEEAMSHPQQSRQMFPFDRLHQLNSRYLAMQLYRCCQCILGCQEAMWEELKDRLRNRKQELIPYGWDDDDELEELQNRTKFEKLVDRFKNDMHLRLSLWHSLTDLGWNSPDREPLTKAELVEEERIRANILEARKQAKPEEFDIPCRSVRVLVGCKL
ncbi:hypothetical protein AGABI2DRAFT_182094 [Agaricus bisporus var. bisporus H97]|uniref:hypothetical protein n=1 Tax=Agaricus bisporus var. bisporus (strain H97 / ATCC MYA-4626 / FGSC 10389) TaxID=936046 RepID=UPI00029F6CAA|nr:hypothetical protein AGABI2DRAFT_182094 [Agaricus bisporus var. bisporus H97]EKV51119.1 hypothetical protein AGABI2DRAFT_182094 [Agaricus bisporus var. bisporus H97]